MDQTAEKHDSLNQKFALANKLFTDHRKSIFDHLCRKTKGNVFLAQDLTSETFIKAMLFIESGRYVDQRKSYSWLKTIARNTFLDHVRKTGKHPVLGFLTQFDGPADPEPITTELMVNSVIMEEIRKLIKHLPTEQQDVVRLRFYENKMFKEIAAMKNVSINTVIGRMRYALINLRKIIARHGIDLDGYKPG
jgi:RNA polymerase sigma-70 factor (ECF subfamily)